MGLAQKGEFRFGKAPAIFLEEVLNLLDIKSLLEANFRAVLSGLFLFIVWIEEASALNGRHACAPQKRPVGRDAAKTERDQSDGRHRSIGNSKRRV